MRKGIYYFMLCVLFLLLWGGMSGVMAVFIRTRPSPFVMSLGVTIVFGVFETIKPLIKKWMKIK